MGVITWYQSLGLRESACTVVGVCVVGLKPGKFLGIIKIGMASGTVKTEVSNRCTFNYLICYICAYDEGFKMWI